MKLNWLLPLLLIASSSCSDIDRPTDPEKTSGQISFGLSDTSAGSRATGQAMSADTLTLLSRSDTVTTFITVTEMDAAPAYSRGIPVSDIDGLDRFSIYSFYYSTPTADAVPFFSNEPASRKTGYWTTDTPYYWPTVSGSTLSFWAFTDINAPGVTITPSKSDPAEITISYTVPPQAANQHDLMLATTPQLNTPRQRVPLKFNHLCAAVRFVTGKEMQSGTIKSIILSGIKNQGQYTTAWSELAGSADFTIDINKNTDVNTDAGTAITPDYNTLMMIPQQLSDDATLTVVFHDNFTGIDRNLSASLKGQTWKQGTTTTYHIGISPDFNIEFTQPVDIQDANYVICNTTARITGITADKTWTLTVSASDSSDPSVQLTSDVNQYVRLGFWTDKEMRNGTTITDISARGSNTVSGKGPGDFPLTVFLPENITETNRIVTLSLHIDGTPSRYTATQEITQLPPIWNGNTGWEQIDDSHSGVFGFQYDARHVYVYNNSHTIIPANNVINHVKDLISQYNASEYARVERYNVSIASYRNYVEIDYSKLNQLGTNAQSTSDGLLNTRQLFTFGGTALSNNFEKALLEMRRINDSSTQAYVRRRDTDPAAVPQWIEGTLINDSQILADVLKKNRYYINTSTVGDLTTTTAFIRAEDIVWYIPASGQFASAPKWYGGAAMSIGDFWSSTVADIGYAYTGNSTTAPRTETKLIRIARNR